MSNINFNTAYKLLEILGHKKKPKHPEESFQNALNTIRKKGYITTIEPGEYKMTKTGYRKLKEPEQKRFKEAFQILIESEKTERINA